MATSLARLLALALCCFATAEEFKTGLLFGVGPDDVTMTVWDSKGFEKDGTFVIDTKTYTVVSVSGQMVTFTPASGVNHDMEAKVVATSPVVAAPAAPAVPLAAADPNATNTTLAPFDSSASSSSGSSDSSALFLASANSDSLHGQSSESSPSVNSGSDMSGSGSSGSTQSGSSGSYLEFWQWIVVAILLCCCLGGGGAAAMGGKKKPKKKKSAARRPAAAPVAPEPVPEAVATMEPLVMPMATTGMMPSYSMVQPAYTQQGMTYAAPATTSLAGYNAGYNFAAPATAQYMMPGQGAYAAAPTYAAAPAYATTSYAQY